MDKVLNGAEPADLPIEQASRHELVINLKTAKALGLTIPRSPLLRADELIQYLTPGVDRGRMAGSCRAQRPVWVGSARSPSGAVRLLTICC